MTGYGSADGDVLGGRLRVDIRTVNHRYFNPQLKLPADLAGVEGSCGNGCASCSNGVTLP